MSKKRTDLPLVAVIGRPNVGKSSLINRLADHSNLVNVSLKAIVHPTPGVTRDRKYFYCFWNNIHFRVIDTAGFFPPADKNIKNVQQLFQKEIGSQLTKALEEAVLILFVVDAIDGFHPYDQEIAAIVRRTGKPFLLVINKVDTQKRQENAPEFHRIGAQELFPISALHGYGVADLLDQITKQLKILTPDLKEGKEPLTSNNIKIAIVGRPNAGKSSLLNLLLNEERAIVSPIAGTTRDTIDAEVTWEGKNFTFIDTAGIRKKAKVKEDIEYYSVNRAIQAIENCDIAVLLIDAQSMVEEQDQKIGRIIADNHKGVLVLVNKWDLVKKDTHTILHYTAQINDKLPYLSYAPQLFISIKEKQRVFQIYGELDNIYKNYSLRLPTARTNELFRRIVAENPPKAYKGKIGRIYYATQIETNPPAFLVFVNNERHIHYSYRNYLINAIRKYEPFTGSPIKLVFRNKTPQKK